MGVPICMYVGSYLGTCLACLVIWVLLASGPDYDYAASCTFIFIFTFAFTFSRGTLGTVQNPNPELSNFFSLILKSLSLF